MKTSSRLVLFTVLDWVIELKLSVDLKVMTAFVERHLFSEFTKLFTFFETNI